MRTPFIVLLLTMAAGPAGADDAGPADDGTHPRLTPYIWRKPAETQDGAADDGSVRKLHLQVPAREPDELVCEKGVVYPTQPPPGGLVQAVKQNPMNLLSGAMGVQHCWKKSDPSRIIERPWSMANMIAEGAQDSSRNSFNNAHPLGSGLADFSKKKKKRKKGSASKPDSPPPAAAVPASNPRATGAPPPPGDASGETSAGTPVVGDQAPALLR
ncbi:MAG: hypothetical protein ACHQ2Z_00545 [Elusimicrobiota bacterium]